MVFGKEFRSHKPFLAKSIAVGAGLMLALVPATQCLAVDQPVNFKIYSPQEPPAAESTPARTEDTSSIFEAESPKLDETPAPAKTEAPVETPSTATVSEPKPEVASPLEKKPLETKPEETVETKSESSGSKVLQGYIRVVPTGTKIPIIMDTAVDSDTSQEGDEFSARTSEDLTIDGSTVVPAGSIIKGRIAQMNGPRALNRSGSVALKFDTITTPDNRQIPLVANIVARGGVVHARRGMKDVALDCGTVSLPTLCGLGIGVLAGNSSSSSSSSSSGVGAAGGAMIGAGIGLAVGVAVLLAKKGKKVEVRPGDELKIELAEDLRMPTM